MPRLPTLLLCLAAALPAQAAEPGHHGKPADARKPLVLTAEEAVHVRLEMRVFLASVQKIVTAAAHNDMKVVAEAAREAGLAAAHEVPASLRQKLPLEFRQLGHATHTGFDDLARDAESMADANLAQKQLGQVMKHCVSCHALYRVEPAPRKR
jgi:hypothetical protein